MRSLALACLALTACGFEPLAGETTLLPVTKAAPASRTALGSIENGLAYDGCSFPITIDKTDYAPSASSRALVQAIAGKKIGHTRVTLTYRLLDGMGSVECGWGSAQTLPEIEVLSLAPAVSTADVVIRNELPADGCSYPVELNGVRYAPSRGSQARVEQFATRFGANPATIDYELTGGVAIVTCGWGATQQLPEIDVLAIRPRS